MTEADIMLPLTESGLKMALETLAAKEEYSATLHSEIDSIKTYVESCIVTLGLPRYRFAGYNIFWRENTPSHRMNWVRLQKERPELYHFLLDEHVASLTMPKREKSLVFTKSMEANP